MRVVLVLSFVGFALHRYVTAPKKILKERQRWIGRQPAQRIHESSKV